jgi:hypothetical protein
LLTTSCFELLQSLEIKKPPVAIAFKFFQKAQKTSEPFFSQSNKTSSFWVLANFQETRDPNNKGHEWRWRRF